MFLFDQILVNSHWELYLMCLSKEKEMEKQNLAWFVGYIASYANRNMFKKHI